MVCERVTYHVGIGAKVPPSRYVQARKDMYLGQTLLTGFEGLGQCKADISSAYAKILSVKAIASAQLSRHSNREFGKVSIGYQRECFPYVR